jgi:hypothetical protein
MSSHRITLLNAGIRGAAMGVLYRVGQLGYGLGCTVAALIFLSGFAVTVEEGPTLGLLVFGVAASVWGLAAVWRHMLVGKRAERHIVH